MSYVEIIDGLFWMTIAIVAWLILRAFTLKAFFTPEEGEERVDAVACPICGGRNLKWDLSRESYARGSIFNQRVCGDCGYVGVIVEEDGNST